MARNKLNVQIAQMARAAEEAARMRQVDAWRYAGHLSCKTAEDPLHVDVTLGDENFHEARRTFPTTNFIARAALAIAAGQSNRNNEPAEYPPLGGYTADRAAIPKATWHNLSRFEGRYNYTPKQITAKVTPRSNIKGLRP